MNMPWKQVATYQAMRWTAMAGALAMTGCSAVQMSVSSGSAGTPVAGVAMSGVVHGGQFPIAGATIQLYAVGTTDYGSEAYPLLNIVVTTGSNGAFNFTTSNWTCVPGTYIYLTATGGTEQTQGSANPYSANVAALGNCSNINSNSYIVVNEVTTVAAVWALQQFISIIPGTSLLTQPGTAAGVTPAKTPAFSIGTSSTNMQGLQNAFAVAAVLADTNSGGTPGGFAAGYTGPGTQANRALTVETWHISTIADVLASCINSNPQGGSTTCSTLATSVTPSGTAPADTLEIAYEMAQNPTYNVSNTFGFATGGGTPFLPYDGAVADWTVAYKVAYTYSANTSLTDDFTVMNTGEGIAFDSFGNAWVANTGHSYSYLPAFVTELGPTGDFVSTYSSYNVGTTPTNFGIAVSGNFFMPLVIDPSNNIWTEDTGNSNLVRIAATSGVSVASTGTNYGISTGTTTLTGNSAMASDANGEIYAGLGGGSGAAFNAAFGTNNDKGIALLVPSIGSSLTAGTGSLVAPSGNTTFKGMAVTQSLSGTYGGGGFLYATSTASICSSPNGAALNMYFTQAATVSGATSGSTTTSVGEVTPVNAIVDTGGTTCSSVGAKVPTASSTYASTPYTVPAMATPVGLGVDSSDNVWVVNEPSTVTVTGYPEYWITELTPTYTTGATTGALSASYTPQLFTAPFLAGLSGAANYYTPNTGAFVDGSNNVWSISGGSYGTVAALNATSGFLNNSSTFTTTLTSGTSTQTWTCGGFCGGLTYAQYSNRRAGGSGFSGAAVDLSGNVWAVQSVSGGNSVTVFVGVAGPTVAPISLAAKNHAFGKKP